MSEIPAPPAPHSPTVTVIIPMRNESGAIGPCIESVLASALPDGVSFELLILDGESTDDSVAQVAAIAERDARVRLLPNPDRLQAAAFNLGIAAARGRYVVRMDAHSWYAPDYIAESIRLLEETGAENVGGVQRAQGKTLLSRAVAAAVSSRFAAGDAQYRNATEPCFTDTVYLGCWRLGTLQQLGGMRTDWAVNEDYEMNVRLRAMGGKVYLSPTVQSLYQVRASLPKLARQYFRYGFWKVRTLLHHPRSLRWRQVVAPAFVLSLLMTPLTIAWLGWLGMAHIIGYVIANFAASVLTARKSGMVLLPILPVVFAVVHLSWGIGFWCGLAYWPFTKRASA